MASRACRTGASAQLPAWRGVSVIIPDRDAPQMLTEGLRLPGVETDHGCNR
jgi:hypothetical protein